MCIVFRKNSFFNVYEILMERVDILFILILDITSFQVYKFSGLQLANLKTCLSLYYLREKVI